MTVTALTTTTGSGGDLRVLLSELNSRLLDLQSQITALGGTVSFEAADKVFETRTALQAATVSGAGSTINALATRGYAAAGDGGAALYKYYGNSAPAHAGYVTTNGGAAYWEIVPARDEIDCRALGVLDDDGSTNRGAELKSACEVALALGAKLRVDCIVRIAGASEYEVDVSNATLEIVGRGTLLCERTSGDTAFRFLTTQIGSNRALTSDRSIGAYRVILDDVSGVADGGLIYLEAAGEYPNTARAYSKNCVRRVADLNSNSVYLDQPLFWPFTTAETAVMVYPPGKVILRGVKVSCPNYACGVGFWRLSDALVEDCTFEGPDEYDNTTTDMAALARCDGFIFERCVFRNFRYVSIAASRNTRVLRFLVDGVRHVDANTWSENTLLEDGYGARSETLIQDHDGAIGTTIRRVYDMNTDAALYGLNMRGIGWTVEDCEAHSTHGNTGVDTCGVTPGNIKAGYEGIFEAAVCRLTRFRSSTAKIGNRGNGTLIVRDCAVPGIDITQSYGTKRLLIDQKTVSPDNAIVLLTDANRHEAEEIGPYHIGDAADGYYATGGNFSVTGITQAASAVVTTSIAHGLAVNDIIWLAGITAGPTSLNNAFYKVISVPSSTQIGIGNASTGAAIDTSGLTAWSAGGNVKKQLAANECAIVGFPGIGWYPALRYSVRLYQSTAQLGSTTLTLPVTLKHDQATTRFDSRTGTLRIKVQTSEGASEYVFGYRSETGVPSAFTVWQVAGAAGGTAATVTITGAAAHFLAQMSSEKTTTTIGSQLYAFFNLNVTVSASTVVVRQVVLEVEEMATPTT